MQITPKVNDWSDRQTKMHRLGLRETLTATSTKQQSRQNSTEVDIHTSAVLSNVAA